jgi:hypothetical protein
MVHGATSLYPVWLQANLERKAKWSKILVRQGALFAASERQPELSPRFQCAKSVATRSKARVAAMTNNRKASVIVSVIGLSWLFGGVIGSSEYWLLLLVLLFVLPIMAAIILERRIQNGQR